MWWGQPTQQHFGTQMPLFAALTLQQFPFG